MKRVVTLTNAWNALAIAFLLTFSTVVFAQRQVPAAPAAAPGENEILNNYEVRSAALDLFRASRAVPHSVRAMWVTFENGKYRVIPWPPSHGYYMETWKGSLPKFTVAIVHTHPINRSGRPSAEDQDLANGKQMSGIRLPVYTLHHDGISKVVPGGSEPVQVYGAGWINQFGPRYGESGLRLAHVKAE